MAKCWLGFMYMVEILIMNIHAVKTNNWEEFKASLCMMMPWQHIFDDYKK